MAKRKFMSKKNAINFSKKVNGELKDYTKDDRTDYKYRVDYDGTPKKVKFWDSKPVYDNVNNEKYWK